MPNSDLETNSVQRFVNLFRRKNARGETRVPVGEPATITILTGDPTRIACILTDLSKSGAGLQVEEFIMRGLPVEVRWSGGEIYGHVQYCRPVVGSSTHKLGVRITPR